MELKKHVAIMYAGFSSYAYPDCSSQGHTVKLDFFFFFINFLFFYKLLSYFRMQPSDWFNSLSLINIHIKLALILHIALTQYKP